MYFIQLNVFQKEKQHSSRKLNIVINLLVRNKVKSKTECLKWAYRLNE